MNKKNILFIILIIFSFLCLICFHKIGYTTKKEVLLDYYSKKNLDYKINLYENNFIEGTIQGKNLTYITELVNSITMNFDYEFNINNNVDYKYKYRISGNVISKYEDENIVWDREILYYESKNLSSNKLIKINQEIEIDFKELINAATSFKNQFNLDATTKYQIKLSVILEGNTNLEDLIVCEFPIDQQAFLIKTDYKETNKDIILNEIKYFSFINFVFSLIEILVIIYCSIKLFKYYKKYIDETDIFDRKLKKILRQNNEIIVEVLTNIKLVNEVKVKDFNQLLDLEFESKIPINLYRTKNLALFYIIQGKITYTYTLKK